MTRRRLQRGFTLIEVMIATSILVLVVTLTWGSFKGTFATKAQIEAQSGRYRTVRIALDRLARDLSMLYVSQNEQPGMIELRTRVVGHRRSDIDDITFSYFGHQRLYQDANECDTALVQYYGVRDRNGSGHTNLMRRETRRLANLKPEEIAGESDLICDDVVSLHIDYWDVLNKQWRDSWDTMAADGQRDRTPSKIRVTLTVHDERGREVPFSTETRVVMTEPLNLQPRNQ